MKQILIVTTSPDQGSREDYSILYSGYLLVKSETLIFDEPVFDEFQTHQQLVRELEALGYQVESMEPTIIEVDS